MNVPQRQPVVFTFINPNKRQASECLTGGLTFDKKTNFIDDRSDASSTNTQQALQNLFSLLLLLTGCEFEIDVC